MTADRGAGPSPMVPVSASRSPGRLPAVPVSVDRARATVFGEVADAYDAGRAGYHPDLAPAVLDYAGPGRRGALEIGAGTGKATTEFTARGVGVVCVEPDPRMAEVLRRNAPTATVEVSLFERWQRAGRRFPIVLAGTSWHWLDPVRRWDLVVDALEPGGVVALFWNPAAVIDPGLHAELTTIDARHGIDRLVHGEPASAYGTRPGGWEGWPAAELRADSRFRDVRELRFRREVTVPADVYVRGLTSLSAYRIIPAGRRDAALAATARAIGARGGEIALLQLTDLVLARVG